MNGKTMEGTLQTTAPSHAATARSTWLFALAVMMMGSSVQALAETTLLLDEPAVAEQPMRYQLTVFDDGIAHLHLRSSDPNTPIKLDSVVLSAFKADGRPVVVVGLGSEGRAGTPFPYLQDVSLAANAPPLRLNGSALEPDVLYSGDLSATVHGGKTLIWHVSLSRPSAMAPFVCPRSPQVLNSDGSSNFEFRRTSLSGAGPIHVQLSAFISKDLETGQVGLRPEGMTPNSNLVTEEDVGETQTISPLQANALSEGDTYSGKVRFLRDSKIVLECQLDLQMPRTAKGELASDVSILTRQVTLWWPPFTTTETTFVAHLFEKTRLRRLSGVSAYLDGPSESPEGSLDFAQHVSVSLGDASTDPRRFAPDITQLCTEGCKTSNPDSRAILAGEQRKMQVTVQDMQAGKYAFAIRMSAVNATGTLPRIDVTVNARHAWLYAALVAVLSSILSFFVTKGFVNWRERLRILNQIRELERDSANDHPELPSTTFLRAILDQTEKLIKPLKYFAPPDSVYDYLARAQRTASVLRKYSAVMSALDDAECEDYVKLHYREAIATAMRRISSAPLDQPTADAVIQDLVGIAARLDDPMVWYWSTLKAKAQSLALEASAVQQQLGDTNVVGPLLTALQAPPQSPTRDFDQKYWAVYLLYSRRDAPDDIKHIVAAYPTHQLVALLRLADRLIWKRLESAIKKGQVFISTIPSTDHAETYQPIAFALSFDDPVLESSYFIHDVIKYSWQFELTPDTQANESNAYSWTRTLNGPRITQYARLPGKLTVKVLIKSPFDPDVPALQLAPKILTIKENSEFSFTKSLDTNEVVLTIGVSAAALITSLPALYFSKPTFGSFADYAAILAWAVGIDQGKNLIQALKAFPTDGPAERTASAAASGK